MQSRVDIQPILRRASDARPDRELPIRPNAELGLAVDLDSHLASGDATAADLVGRRFEAHRAPGVDHVDAEREVVVHLDRLVGRQVWA